MEDVFISNIKINKVRHLENLEIPLSGEERKHLILTGKNGSGKTSLLLALKDFIRTTFHSGIETDMTLNKILKQYGNEPVTSPLIKKDLYAICYFNDTTKTVNTYLDEMLLFSYFGINRPSEFTLPLGPKKIEIKQIYNIDEKANKGFMQHMANLRFNYLNAVVSHDKSTEKAVDTWINKFKDFLIDIFDDKNLDLIFDSINFKYTIHSQGKVFDLSTLSDGFSAIINIVTEIMMRMENKKSVFYDMQGIVLIDEIETHLHIDLQKKILPFLTKFFPKIQFIVTTHSPFVLTSIKDAIVYDLEHQEAIEDLSGYSVEAIIEGYFDSDKYSVALNAKVDEYGQLMSKANLSSFEEEELKSLDKYFDDLSGVFADELKLKIEQIRLLNPVR